MIICRLSLSSVPLKKTFLNLNETLPTLWGKKSRNLFTRLFSPVNIYYHISNLVQRSGHVELPDADHQIKRDAKFSIPDPKARG